MTKKWTTKQYHFQFILLYKVKRININTINLQVATNTKESFMRIIANLNDIKPFIYMQITTHTHTHDNHRSNSQSSNIFIIYHTLEALLQT